MTAKSISRIVIALIALLAIGGIVFAIQYFHRGPVADASTASATTTDAKPAAPVQNQALASAQSEANALVSSLGGASPLPPQSNDGVPKFHLAPLEPTGRGVHPRRAAPRCDVELLRNGEPHDRAVADQS